MTYVPRKTASIKDLQLPPGRTRSEDSGQAFSIPSEKKGLTLTLKAIGKISCL